MSKMHVKDGSVDAGLILLAAATPAGRCRTLREIADACGCSLQYIQQIEKSAMFKLREALEQRGIRGELLSGNLGQHASVDYSWLYDA
jgi:hypothetical protein